MIDPFSPTPLYRQVAEVLAERITSGTLKPDRPIPSEKQVQDEFGVSRVTARKAVEVLRDRGLVVTLPQRGTFVLPPEPRPKATGGRPTT